MAYYISDRWIKFIKPIAEARGKENRVPLVLLKSGAAFLESMAALDDGSRDTVHAF